MLIFLAKLKVSYENTLATPKIPTTSIVTPKIIVPNIIIGTPNGMPNMKGYNPITATINANNPTRISKMSIDFFIGYQFYSVGSE
jgi:hypothetical protein